MSHEVKSKGDSPDSFALAVLMEAQPSDNPWIDYQWRAAGVVVNSRLATQTTPVEIAQAEGRQPLWSGLKLKLYKDEAESYYHNLTVAQPLLFVICEQGEDGAPQPISVSASFDEANAYVEMAEDVFSVPMPAELYQWIEAFVLEHYIPQRRTKRKRQNWKETQGG